MDFYSNNDGESTSLGNFQCSFSLLSSRWPIKVIMELTPYTIVSRCRRAMSHLEQNLLRSNEMF
jgi:hypothetical protein